MPAILPDGRRTLETLADGVPWCARTPLAALGAFGEPLRCPEESRDNGHGDRPDDRCHHNKEHGDDDDGHGNVRKLER